MKDITIRLKHVDAAAHAGKDSISLAIPELKLKMKPWKRVRLWEITTLDFTAQDCRGWMWTPWFEVGISPR